MSNGVEAWQSWFNAPDLKSDVGASLPGVRIPALPPVRGAVLRDRNSPFFVLNK